MKKSDVAQKGLTQNSTSTHAKAPLHSNSRRGAPHPPARRAASIFGFFFGLIVLTVPLAEQARAEPDHVWFALTECRGQNSTASVWREDRTTLCFDGPIESNLDLSIFYNLKLGGYVVMRSPGGDPHTAMLLSEILREKDALVILYDYCLSACADYVLVANRTFVRKETIVAWRGDQNSVLGMVMKPWCHGAGWRQRPEKLFDSRGRQIKDRADSLCERAELNKAFFRERGLDDRYIRAPQTHYTKKKVRSVLAKETDHKRVYWMWNPKNYGDHFKSKVSFDSYPRSQREVDSMIARYRLGVRVVFDP